MGGFHHVHFRRIGLALSGGSVRGLAHIGVVKAISAAGIQPTHFAGTSAGSLVGAFLAAGMDWRELTLLAQKVFWPRLLHGGTLGRFCAQYLPTTFSELKYPFAAVATEEPGRRTFVICEGIWR